MKQIIDYFKNLGVDANTTATIFITFFVFIAGLLATLVASQLKKRNSKNSYKKVFLKILKDFDGSCREQERLINESLNKHKSLEVRKSLSIKINPINTLDYLNKLDHHVFLDNFRPLFGQKHFFKVSSKLFTLIAVIREQNTGIQDYITKYTSDLKIVLNDFMEGGKGLRDILDQVILIVRTNLPEYLQSQLWYDGYISVFVVFANSGKHADSQFFHNEVAKKIIDLNNSVLDCPLAVEAGRLARQCDISQGLILQKEADIIDRFSRFSWNHRLAYKLTTLIIKTLQ